jgi:hypothetical protein
LRMLSRSIPVIRPRTPEYNDYRRGCSTFAPGQLQFPQWVVFTLHP